MSSRWLIASVRMTATTPKTASQRRSLEALQRAFDPLQPKGQCLPAFLEHPFIGLDTRIRHIEWRVEVPRASNVLTDTHVASGRSGSPSRRRFSGLRQELRIADPPPLRLALRGQRWHLVEVGGEAPPRSPPSPDIQCDIDASTLCASGRTVRR